MPLPTAYLMYEFHALWVEERPENMMAYPRIKKVFDERVKAQLARDTDLPVGELAELNDKEASS